MANVVLLMSDEHNPFYSSVYGHPFVHTPNMERLARSGSVYLNAYCPSPLCLPSRSAFLAGKRVHALQTYSNCNLNLNPHHPSYGSVLSQQGVHTAYIGKTDVYARGNQLGFDEMILPGDRRLPGDTNHRRNPLTIRKGAAARAGGFGPRKDAGERDKAYVEAAITWLRTRAPTNKPWVLVLNVTRPHFPHYVSRELWDLYSDGGDLPAYGAEVVSANHPYARDLRAHFETDQFTQTQTRGLRRGYYGCVTHVDRALGEILDVLEETGTAKTTNVIYTSDHGEMLGKFGMWWKCSLYEDAARVPCVAAGPDFPQGKRIKTPVDLYDVQAALFKAVDAARPREWVGEPLQDVPDDDSERTVFAEYHGHGTRASAYMMRQGHWKYIHYAEAPHQLFDLDADPDELNDLFDAHPDVARHLEQELRKICSPEKENRRAEAFIQQQLQAQT